MPRVAPDVSSFAGPVAARSVRPDVVHSGARHGKRSGVFSRSSNGTPRKAESMCLGRPDLTTGDPAHLAQRREPPPAHPRVLELQARGRADAIPRGDLRPHGWEPGRT